MNGVYLVIFCVAKVTNDFESSSRISANGAPTPKHPVLDVVRCRGNQPALRHHVRLPLDDQVHIVVSSLDSDVIDRPSGSWGGGGRERNLSLSIFCEREKEREREGEGGRNEREREEYT